MSRRGKTEKLTPREEAKVNETFNSFKNKKYSEEDMKKVFDKEEKIMDKMNDKKLSGFIEDVKLFYSMLKDYFSGKYKAIPVGTIMAIVGSLLYVFLPTDIIPDFIPFIGFIDDAAIMSLCVKGVSSDLNKYKEFIGISKE